jgi:hypothetical protein
MTLAIAPGTRVVVRDEEWLVRNIHETKSDGLRVEVTGISDLVPAPSRAYHPLVPGAADTRRVSGRVLDDRVGAREQEPGLAVVKPHQVRRLALGPVHLYDLAVPVRVPDGVSVNADTIADCRFHARAPFVPRCPT